MDKKNKLNIPNRDLEATKMCLPILENLYKNFQITENVLLIGGYSIFFNNYSMNRGRNLWRGSHDLDFIILSQSFSNILDPYISTKMRRSHLPNKYQSSIDEIKIDVYIPDYSGNIKLGNNNFNVSGLECKIIPFKNSKIRIPKVIENLRLKLNIKNLGDNGKFKRRDKDIFDIYCLLNGLSIEGNFKKKYGNPSIKTILNYLSNKLDGSQYEEFKEIFREYKDFQTGLAETIGL